MTIAIGVSTSNGSIIATDSRLTMQLKHRLFVRSDATTKIFQLNDCLLATAGQYNLKFNNQWLSIKEFLLNFTARHPDLTAANLANSLQQELANTNLASNDFILAKNNSVWHISHQTITKTPYIAIGQQAAVDEFYSLYPTFTNTGSIEFLATELKNNLTHFIAVHPQFGKIGGPVQIACSTNNDA